MYAWELIKETLLRRSFIVVVHLVWFCLYFFLPLMSSSGDLVLGTLPFILAGLLLPVIVSIGIFGDDIASGRIAVLVTKPLRFSRLYLWRLAGIVVQGALHLAVAGVILLGVNRVWGYGSVAELPVWLVLSLLLLAAVAALSTTISVVAKRDYNLMILIGVLLLAVVFKVNLASVRSPATECVRTLITYGLPSVEMLYRCGAPACSFPQRLGAALYVLALTGTYAVIGVVLLKYREFKRTCD
jgi:hypothetical protein